MSYVTLKQHITSNAAILTAVMFAMSGIASLFVVSRYAEAACADLSSDFGRSVYSISDVEAGDHSLWLRVKANDGSPSLRYSIHGQNATDDCDNAVTTSNASDWVWVESNSLFSTNGGDATLQISGREAGVGVDCFVLTSDTSFTPEGTDGCNGPQEDTTGPNLSITSPSEDATISGVQAINTDVSDPESAISQVGFFIGGRNDLDYFDRSAPFNYPLDTEALTDGDYTITVVATNVADVSTAATVNVTIDNAAVYPFCDDDAANNTGELLPCTYDEPDPDPVCEDDAANNAGQPLPCTFDPVDETPPTVSLTSPTDDVTFNDGNIALRANAADETGLARVEFYIDGDLVRTDSTAPYSRQYSVASLSLGSHDIYAKAIDTSGNETTTPTITITREQLLKEGDVNGDGRVSLADFFILVQNFNRDGVSRSEGDLNGDGRVSLADFFILSVNFGS